MNKDNRHTALVFSKNYFTAIVVSIIVTFASFYFAGEVLKAQSFAFIGPLIFLFLLAILNVIIALVCFFSIVLRNKVMQYSWVLFYFVALFFYMFRLGPTTIWVTHPDPDVRARHADDLRSVKKNIPLLLRMLNDEDKRVRVVAAVGLGKMGVKQGVDALMNIIETDNDVLLRTNLARDLGWINDPKGNDFLFDLFKSEDQKVREIAFEGIRQLDYSTGDKYMEFIISVINDENEDIRKSAAVQFLNYSVDGKLDQQLVEVLLPLLKDKSAAVRESVAIALSGNSDQKTVEYLLPLLKDPSPGVRERTVRALGASGNPLVIDPLISAAQDEDNWEVRDAIVRWIGSKGIKDRRAIEFLLSTRKSFLDDEYGVIYWESKGFKEFWLYNWQFKTKNKFIAIEIVFVDQDGKQEILVDNKTMNNFPLEFRLCLSDPRLLGNLENPDLLVSLRYLRTEDQGRSYSIDTSYRQKLQGNKLKNVVYNKISSLEDQFNQSGEITLATYTTFDDAHEFTSAIKIKYEIQQE